MVLTNAGDIKKKWQKYIEELYKKNLMTKITTMVASPTDSQTSWNPKLSAPQEASPWTKIVEVITF